MNAVVDTNVIAYYLLGTEPYADESRRFWRAVDEVRAPSVWAAELANVICMAVRMDVVGREHGRHLLTQAGRLSVRTTPTRGLWHGALARAIDADVTVYDTLFVELAVRSRLPLVTYDRKLAGAFPDVACRPADLASAGAAWCGSTGAA